MGYRNPLDFLSSDSQKLWIGPADNHMIVQLGDLPQSCQNCSAAKAHIGDSEP